MKLKTQKNRSPKFLVICSIEGTMLDLDGEMGGFEQQKPHSNHLLQ